MRHGIVKLQTYRGRTLKLKIKGRNFAIESVIQDIKVIQKGLKLKLIARGVLKS